MSTSPSPVPTGHAATGSRRWRSIWRLHFYAGIVSAPVLAMLAVTGIVILYAQPLAEATNRDLMVVEANGTAISLDEQAGLVRAAFPGRTITSVTPPRDDTTSSAFGLSDGVVAYVDPYDAEVLGTRDPQGGLAAFSERLHGSFNNSTLTVPLPVLGGIFGDEPAFRDIAVGDLCVEVFASWAAVLAISGVYLWWPRKRGVDKALVVPRLSKRGRARWRDLHAIPGVAASSVLLLLVFSGLPWAGFWGANFGWAADRITPGTYEDAPLSTKAKLGDVDRFGNHINWVFRDLEVPASATDAHANHAGAGATPTHAHVEGMDMSGVEEVPERLSLESVHAAALEEGLLAGYTIMLPENSIGVDGSVIYGAYSASNAWPGRSQDARTVFFDQFTGATLGGVDLYGYGAIQRTVDYTVSTHMGTQFGLVNRIAMTTACLAVLWLTISAVVMYSKRRRTGTLGLPRRPRDVRLANGLLAIFAALAVVFPLWGVSALAVLTIDRFVIRRVGRLRVLFGQRATT